LDIVGRLREGVRRERYEGWYGYCAPVHHNPGRLEPSGHAVGLVEERILWL
jgi:hypothetical protein